MHVPTCACACKGTIVHVFVMVYMVRIYVDSHLVRSYSDYYSSSVRQKIQSTIQQQITKLRHSRNPLLVAVQRIETQAFFFASLRFHLKFLDLCQIDDWNFISHLLITDCSRFHYTIIVNHKITIAHSTSKFSRRQS